MIHLGIIEDERLMLESIRETFVNHPEVEVTLTAQTLEDALEELAEGTPLTTLFLDINLPGMSGLEGIPKLKALRPDLDIIMVTNKDGSDDILKAICEGAVSYISKKKVSPPVLRDAVVTVSRGESYMSPSIARKIVHLLSQPTPQQQRTTTAAPKMRSQLTDRQFQIVESLTKGNSYKMIGQELGISVETVRDHIKKIYRILQVNSKAEVIRQMFDGKI